MNLFYNILNKLSLFINVVACKLIRKGEAGLRP